MQTMRTILTSRRAMIGIGIVLLVALLFSSIFIKPAKKESTKTSPAAKKPALIRDKNINRVFIKDFYTYSDYFSAEKQQAVENILYGYASLTSSTPDFYTATIRKDSFSQTKNTSGGMVTRITIDIIPANTTYILETSSSNPNGAISIKCAPKDIQKDQKSSCIDETAGNYD